MIEVNKKQRGEQFQIFQNRFIFVPRLSLLAVGTLILVANGLVVSAFGQTCIVSDPEVRRQRTALANLNPASKATLWKRHLKYQLRTRNFTSDQRRVIKKGLELVTEDRYRESSTPDLRDELEPSGRLSIFSAEIRTNFTKEDVLLVFNRIEPAIFNTYLSTKPKLMQNDLLPPVRCTCFNGGGGQSSECTGSGCEQGLPGWCTSSPGCGDLGFYHCNGKCTPFG